MNTDKITATQQSKKRRQKIRSLFFVFAALQLGGCANLGVQPWERDLLAKDEMALSADPVDLGLDDHIYFSKEATSGGRSFAGGGCGCN
jgi:hypothetical protein